MTLDTALDVSATLHRVPDYPQLFLAIAGDERHSQGRATRPVINPASGEIMGHAPLATEQDLADALRSTEAAFGAWSRTSAYERADLLRRAAAWMRQHADEGARLISLELGKVLPEARAEIMLAASLFEWTADEAVRAYGRVIPGRRPGLHLEARVSPVGPVYAVTSWNAPVNTPARKISGALAAGCSIIVKLSDLVPASGLFLYRALVAVGLPDGVLQMVTGRGAQVSEAIIPSPVIRLVTLTGSVELGRTLASQAAYHLKPQTMELGGHAPAIIDRDVNVESVARAAARAKFRNVGQVCTAPTRFYVHRDILSEFTEHFVDEAAGLRVGDPFAEGSEVGPIQSSRHLQETLDLVEDAVAKGATLAAGGTRLGDRGNFFAPAVLTEVPVEADVNEIEPFGPIALIHSYSDVAEAITAANALNVGLSAYGFTDSHALAHRLSTQLQAGNIILNNWNSSFPETPFGGVKESGFGREGGPEGLQEFLMTIFVSQEFPVY